jgi:hypothetical protein
MAARERRTKIGKRLLIDGSAVPAWCQQWTRQDDEALNQQLRRFTPEAGHRSYQHTPKSKRDIEPGADLISTLTLQKVKSWRGYYVVAIFDQPTSLPLVWTVFDASHDEAPALVAVLSLLHKLWPDIDADVIAGDSAWDEDGSVLTFSAAGSFH